MCACVRWAISSTATASRTPRHGILWLLRATETVLLQIRDVPRRHHRVVEHIPLSSGAIANEGDVVAGGRLALVAEHTHQLVSAATDVDRGCSRPSVSRARTAGSGTSASIRLRSLPAVATICANTQDAPAGELDRRRPPAQRPPRHTPASDCFPSAAPPGSASRSLDSLTPPSLDAAAAGARAAPWRRFASNTALVYGSMFSSVGNSNLVLILRFSNASKSNTRRLRCAMSTVGSFERHTRMSISTFLSHVSHLRHRFHERTSKLSTCT